MIGERQYTSSRILKLQNAPNTMCPEKPFKAILQGKFKLSKQIELKKLCLRISFIQGDIWGALYLDNCILVINLKGNTKREIKCLFEPYSVKEAPWGDIIVAGNPGLYMLSPVGTVQSTICGDTFCYVCFLGEEIVGINNSKKVLQTYSRSVDGHWRHSGDIEESRGIGSCICDSVVTSKNEVFTMWGRSRSHYYKCVGKTGQRMEFSSSKQVMDWPFVCGVDSTGVVLVADHHNKTFQIHETDGQWSEVRMESIRSHCPFNFLYHSDTNTVWVVTEDDNGSFYLTKLERLQ